MGVPGIIFRAGNVQHRSTFTECLHSWLYLAQLYNSTSSNPSLLTTCVAHISMEILNWHHHKPETSFLQILKYSQFTCLITETFCLPHAFHLHNIRGSFCETLLSWLCILQLMNFNLVFERSIPLTLLLSEAHKRQYVVRRNLSMIQNATLITELIVSLSVVWP